MTGGAAVAAALGGLILIVVLAFGVARAARAGLRRRLDERQAALRREITETVLTSIHQTESRQMAALSGWRDELRNESRQLADESRHLADESRQLTNTLRDELRNESRHLTEEMRQLREQVLQLEERSRIRAAIPAPTSVASERVAPPGNRNPIEKFFQQLDQTPDAANYLKIHRDRILRTLTLVPPPRRTGRALELGAYMQMTPALARLSGYQEVVGAYAGASGQVERTATSGGEEIFRCNIDLFDAELDVFPYGDAHFDVVLACEIIEHLLVDPMHMLLEIHRVLDDDGALILTTPNVVSFTSVAKALEASGSPQIYSLYPALKSERPHVHEYTPYELEEVLLAAGFHVEYLFTEKIEGCHADVWVREFLTQIGFPTHLRGEQIYCVGRKRQGAATVRRPAFLYEG